MTYNEVFQNLVVVTEGFYSIDKNDSGGETVFGLTRKADPDWQGWKIVDQYRQKQGYPNNLPYDILRAIAAPYYKTKYWDYAKLDQFPSELAYEVFDQSVNMGNGRAIRNLQRALNILNHNGNDYPDLIEDGRFGPNTLNAALKSNVDAVTKYMNAFQGEFYADLAERKPSQEDFTNGWATRLSNKRQ